MRVAVSSLSFCQSSVLRDELSATHPGAKFNEKGRHLSEHEMVELLSGCDATILGLDPLTEGMLERLPELKIVTRMGVGVDNLDPALLGRFGIRMGWTGGTNRQSVAELTICFAIAGLRRVAPLNAGMRAGDRPTHRMGRHLAGRVVGLHGCGNVGKEVVRLLQPFGCTVLACDIQDYPQFYAENGVLPVNMDELVKRSEVLSLHLPLTDPTRGLYRAETLDQLRPDCVLINTCRGGIVDEDALRDRLLDGRIAAACFDVFAVEPPTDEALITAPNFLCTPHIGGSAEEARLAMGSAAIADLTDTFVPEPGEPPFDG